MSDFLTGIFESNFMPHGHCYMWRPEILWLHALSDSAIAFAYYTIPFFLIYFVRKRRDLVYPWIFVMFGAFILLCGTTHVLEVWSIWNGTYRLTGMVKAVTGAVSIATALALVPLVPRALSLTSPEQLRQINDTLRKEIIAREAAEDELRELNQRLEARVAERTAALEDANIKLRMQIAEREKAERSLVALNSTLEDRVAARTAELERSNEELQQINRELQNFASIVSHDLQEPLRKITTFAGLITAEHSAELSRDARMYLGRIEDAALRLSALVRDVLELSRVTSRAPVIQPVDLGRVVTEVLADLEVQVKETDATVRTGDLPTVEADPTQMRQLFQNLIGNALKFHRHDVPPVIEIRASQEEQHGRPFCRLQIQDEGIGFDEQYAEKIFRPFQRLHARAEYPGTGVGLAIVRRIVERHEGTITVTSSVGEGTTFLVSLPLRQSKRVREN